MADRKELIKQYKQRILPMGIFQIRNLVNGKIFVGSSKNLEVFANRHKFQLKLGSHQNKDLQGDYIKYGEVNFVFEIIDLLPEKDDPAYDYTLDLKVLEEMWLEKLQPFAGKGYNSPKTEKTKIVQKQ
jgi:group I intron endonuclease